MGEHYDTAITSSGRDMSGDTIRPAYCVSVESEPLEVTVGPLHGGPPDAAHVFVPGRRTVTLERMADRRAVVVPSQSRAALERAMNAEDVPAVDALFAELVAKGWER